MNREYSFSQGDQVGDSSQCNAYEESNSSGEYPYSYPIWDPNSRMYGHVVVSGVLSPNAKDTWDRVPQYVFNKRDISLLMRAADEGVIMHCHPYDKTVLEFNSRMSKQLATIRSIAEEFSKTDENMNKAKKERSPITTDTNKSGSDTPTTQKPCFSQGQGLAVDFSSISQTVETSLFVESCDATSLSASEVEQSSLTPSFTTEASVLKHSEVFIAHGSNLPQKRPSQHCTQRIRGEDNVTLTLQPLRNNTQHNFNVADIPLPSSCVESPVKQLNNHLPDTPTTSTLTTYVNGPNNTLNGSTNSDTDNNANGTCVIQAVEFSPECQANLLHPAAPNVIASSFEQSAVSNTYDLATTNMKFNPSADDDIDDEIIFVKFHRKRSKVFLTTKESEEKHCAKQLEVIHLVDCKLSSGQQEIYRFLFDNSDVMKNSNVRYPKFDFPPSRAGFVTVVSRTLCFHNLQKCDIQTLQENLRPLIALQVSYRNGSILIENSSRSAAEFVLHIIEKYSLFLNFKELEPSFCNDGFNFAESKTMWDQKVGAWYFPHQLVSSDNLDECLAKGLVNKETMPKFLQEMEEDFANV